MNIVNDSIDTSEYSAFRTGEIYSRAELHAAFGGQPRTRISTPANQRIIFLFADEPVGEVNYVSGWTSYGIFRFVGEGRYGHMKFIRGNRALRHHNQRDKSVHLFLRVRRNDPDTVRYAGEMRYIAHFYKEGVDLRSEPRRMIVFLLKPVSR
jgi:5-methylcytosine-specific restriction protein A